MSSSLSEHEFSFVEFVQIFSVTKYDQTFVGRQNSYSVREAVIYNISFALHRLKEQHIARCKRVRRL